MMSGSHLSKDFFDLVKAIGESKSKQQEDSIIVDEVATLKKRMVEAQVTKKKMKELLIRLVYVEMLGHDASFGYIKAIELAASKNLVQKRVGYLCSGLCLAPSHEFRFMLVNQLQQDMASANYLEVAAALSATLRLATADMIPALVDRVVKLGAHGKELVRKKVAMALHRFYQLDKNAVEHLGDAMRRTLCDKDPSVMCAALCLLHDMIADEAVKFKELVPSFVSILKQVVEHRLPRDFDYHRIPAPWAQLRLLRILGQLGRADQRASEGMYEVLSDVMRRADAGINAGYAIVYECVRTITAIYPNTTLLDEAAKSISRFLASENNNLKYLGITGLAQVVEQHPRYAAQHQLAVIECLEDVDDTLKRKTLDLLYRMINPVNVEFIAQKLLSSLETSTDEFLRSALVSRLCTAAERFAPSNEWYVTTVIKVLQLAGDLVKPDVAQNLVALIAENDDEDDSSLRATAVDECAAMLEWESVPEQLLHILAWILGEYGTLCSSLSLDDLASSLADLCADDARLRASTRARALLLGAVVKTTVRCVEHRDLSSETLAKVLGLAAKYTSSADLDLQQRSLEALAVLDLDVSVQVDVLPYDASLEDPFQLEEAALQGDDALGFLDQFVASALAAGAPPYAPPADDDDDDEEDEVRRAGGPDANKSALKFEAYDRPQTTPIQQHTPALDETALSPPPPIAQTNNVGRTTNAIGRGLGSAGLSSASGPWGRPQATQPQMTPQTPSPFVATSPATPPTVEAPKPELSEKERMAAALFGGVLDDEKPAAVQRNLKKPKQPVQTRPPPAPASKPPAAQKKTQPPPPQEISLLDFTADDLPTQPPPTLDDPFASVVLADPALVPARLSTQEFGTKWGTCHQEHKAEAAPYVAHLTLDGLAATLATASAHAVEAIPATNELILAATHQKTAALVLVHAKLLPIRKVALTVRSSADEAAARALELLVHAIEAPRA